MSVGRIAIFIVIALIGVIAVGAIMVLTTYTLSPWWPFWGGGLAVGTIAGLLLVGVTRKITGLESTALNHLIGSLYLSVVATGTLYSINYVFADATTAHSAPVVIEKKFTKTRHHSRRVGRRYVQGTPYKVYCIEVRFDNGTTKELEVALNRYNKLRTGATTNLNLEVGLLGAMVIKN